MYFKGWRNIICTLCFSLLIITSGEPRIFSSSSASSPSIQVTSAQKALIQNGDLIFRRSDGIGSNMVYMVDQKSVFSHVGLVSREGAQVNVIHVLPDEQGQHGFVESQSLDDFLKTISFAAVYRLREPNPEAAGRAVQNARGFIGKVGFDLQFDLSNADQLYCTELLWYAYKMAGIDLVDGEFDQLSLPFLKSTQFILPSRLVQSRWLDEVFQLSTP